MSIDLIEPAGITQQEAVNAARNIARALELDRMSNIQACVKQLGIEVKFPYGERLSDVCVEVYAPKDGVISVSPILLPRGDERAIAKALGFRILHYAAFHKTYPNTVFTIPRRLPAEDEKFKTINREALWFARGLESFLTKSKEVA